MHKVGLLVALVFTLKRTGLTTAVAIDLLCAWSGCEPSTHTLAQQLVDTHLALGQLQRPHLWDSSAMCS